MAAFTKWLKKQKERPYWEYLSVLGYAAMLLAVLAFSSGHGAFIYEGILAMDSARDKGSEATKYRLAHAMEEIMRPQSVEAVRVTNTAA